MVPNLKEFDVVIFGATGYTGKYVIEELVKSNNINLKWAIAGRNAEKLKSSLEEVQQYVGEVDITKTAIIEADVKNKESIANMCKRTKLLLNCVGPYKLYGEVVVLSCIENGTHHVDLSGELSYLETMQAKYFHVAREKGVYIIEACGFDSIPTDLGVAMLKNKFPGDLNSVESYVQIFQGPEGRSTNIGTFMSAVLSVTDVLNAGKYDRLLKEKVFKKEMVRSNYPPSWRLPLFYSDVVKGWCYWFVGPDERVVERSQMFNNEYFNERPVEIRTYIRMHSLMIAFCYLIFMGIFAFFSLFSFGRNLLIQYPSFFTAGFFTKTGPSRKQVEESSTQWTLVGHGWTQKLAEPTDRHTHKPDHHIQLTISGPEPAYALTSICMVQAALTILQDKMPLEGGVLTPGAAFANTRLSERLENRGISFHFSK